LNRPAKPEHERGAAIEKAANRTDELINAWDSSRSAELIWRPTGRDQRRDAAGRSFGRSTPSWSDWRALEAFQTLEGFGNIIEAIIGVPAAFKLDARAAEARQRVSVTP
jgi:hypothetical protein